MILLLRQCYSLGMDAAIPTGAKSDEALRGDYSQARSDYSTPQEWKRYSDAEHDRWRRLYERQARLKDRYAASPFLSGLERLDCANAIPDFTVVNRILAEASCWQIVCVPGFIPDAVFFDHLANRRFPVTRWIREESELDYLIEPDVFHDFFGHVPMLLDPVFGNFLALYGQAGERAMAMDALDMLARIYWYTVEFGLLVEDGQAKPFGAGILSSAGETVHAASDPDVLRLRFDPERIMRTDYRIDSFQACYFVLESLSHLIDGLVDLDFGPIYEKYRKAQPIPAGNLLSGEMPWSRKD